MNRKWQPILIILVLVLAILVVKVFKPKDEQNKTRSGDADAIATDKKINRDRGFDRRTNLLEYSKHAECRMGCRKISKEEVEEIMKHGKINYNKSDIQNSRCPRYALEGQTRDDQKVRIVYAQCNESTTVVTVIDLEKEWSCDCPGDADKYKNRN